MNKLKIASDMARETHGDVYKLDGIESDKYRFKRFALSVLRGIAKSLQLPKDSFDLRFNAGGPAVSGEATLHHEKFYLQICSVGVMFRRCDGRKDYGSAKMSGGYGNQWAISDFGICGRTELTVEQLTAKLRAMVAVI